MKANKSTHLLNEGVVSKWMGKQFSAWMDKQTGGEYSRLKGEEPEISNPNNPKIINHVATVGYEDYIKRLKNEGIEISDTTSIAANIDRIKESAIEYIQQYMTGKEDPKTKQEILIELKKVSDRFELLPTLNINSLKKFFNDSAESRVLGINNVKNKLSPSSKPPKIINISTLMSNLTDNHEIVFPTGDKNNAGDDVWSIIRKDEVYLLNLPSSIENLISSGSINTPSTKQITHNNYTYTVYPIKKESNLQDIYNKWLSFIGGVAPPSLTGYSRQISQEL